MTKPFFAAMIVITLLGLAAITYLRHKAQSTLTVSAEPTWQLIPDPNLVQSNRPPSPAPSVSIKLRPEELREEISYNASLSAQRDLELTSHQTGYPDLYPDGVQWMGTLTQHSRTGDNNEHIYFDPQAVADRIIDSDLVKEINALLPDIFSQDKQLRANFTSFEDTRHRVWTRTVN